MKIKRKKIAEFKTSEVLFLVIVTCVISLFMGAIVFGNKISTPYKSEQISDELKEFNTNYKYIIDNFYDSIDEEKLLNGALKGVVETLEDEYSIYIDEEDSDLFNIYLDGNYKGLGIVVTNDQDNNVVVSSVVDNSPAAKAGIQTGDIIKKINDKDMTNTLYSELSDYVLKNDNDNFELVIDRNNEVLNLKITRGNVTLKSVTYKTLEENNNKIGYIYISIFSNATYAQFKEALDSLEKQEIDGLIIDVRDNSGGHLSTVVNIVSLFMDSKNVIYQTQTQNKTIKYYSNGNVNKKYPIAVLQNNNSASASEFLSVCLKEQYKAKIIGTQSYGKGTIQELIKLTDGTEYKFTTKKWLSPNGNWINEVGVTPDVMVELDDKYINNPIEENDNQLKTALLELTK